MDITLHAAPDSLRLKLVEEQVSALRTSVIGAFNQLLDLKDLNTGVHSTRLAEWGMRVGQELGLEEPVLQNLEIAALLHDIGKVGVPDAILRKPGKLEPDVANDGASSSKPIGKKKRVLSAAARAKISKASKDRWAKFRAAKAKGK